MSTILLVTFHLLVAVLAFVGYPLLRPAPSDPAADGAPAERQHEQLLAERENALTALKDLELEHDVGNLSDRDYDALRAAQRHKAVAILRELDQAGQFAVPAGSAPSPALDARLEDEIARARERLGAAQAAAPDATPLTCPACGTAHAPQARFCSECGRRFGAAVSCPACGTALSPRDRFCPQCGTPFQQGGADA